MNIKETDEKNKDIIYSTKVFDENNKEKPVLILRELAVGNEKDKRKVVLVLRYKMNDEEQEVVIGTSNQFANRTEKSRFIMKYIAEQFRDNFEGKEGFDSIHKLNEYIDKEKIPFEFSVEGNNIMSYKDKKNVSLIRTVQDNNEGRLISYFSQEQIDNMKKEQNQEMQNYLNAKKWQERREGILEKLDKENKVEKDKFIKGEKITNFLANGEKNPDVKRKLVGKYLMEILEKSDDKSELAKMTYEYIQLKEKGFAINVKVVLEAQRDKCYNEIQKEEKSENTNFKRVEKLSYLVDRINEYLNLFELIKVRRDWNATFTYKIKGLNFDEVKQLCKIYDPKDKEIIKYLNLKERTMCDEKLNKVGIENNYKDSESIKTLYEFLSQSGMSDYTMSDPIYSAKNIVMDREKCISDTVYNHMIKEVVEYNVNDIKSYNKYAGKSEGVKVYQVDDKKAKNGKKRIISDTVKEISSELTMIEPDKSAPTDNEQR